ncbi:MAG: permease prefix domain 1-containing protein [Spirochaetia bacterium]|nr:permease prefix domain 1-containing protein [Spirochaetia bacterium]MCF7953130.1 permease prefix domain 1-containing protein [Spirochaetales bacterium]
MFDLESQIRKWKTHLLSAGSLGHSDIEELESHLRDSIDELTEREITQEEAFLIAVRRLGDVSVIQDEFAKLSTEDLWRQLLVPADNPLAVRRNRIELIIVIGLTLSAGLLSKIPALFGFGDIETYNLLYMKNGGLFAFAPAAIYFIWKRSLPLLRSFIVLSIFPLSAFLINLYPSYEPHHTEFLTALHMPIALIFLLLYFYGGPAVRNSKSDQLNGQAGKNRTGWQNTNTRLNFVRFAGETFIYAVLIGLGGLVLTLIGAGTFELIGIDVFPFISAWVAPFGFFGLFTAAAYLVGQKKNLIESIAPVLARIFTPLFLLILLSLITAYIIHPKQAYENRDMLIWFDLILAFVLGLSLYSMSAKDYTHSTTSEQFVENGSYVDILHKPHMLWDALTLALILSAVIVDGIALSGIISRLSAYGFSPNKTAALGENIILLTNLILLITGYVRYFQAKQSFQKIVEVQMRFLPVYAVWAACVVIVFPPLFNFK